MQLFFVNSKNVKYGLNAEIIFNNQASSGFLWVISKKKKSFFLSNPIAVVIMSTLI